MLTYLELIINQYFKQLFKRIFPSPYFKAIISRLILISFIQREEPFSMYFNNFFIHSAERFPFFIQAGLMLKNLIGKKGKSWRLLGALFPSLEAVESNKRKR